MNREPRGITLFGAIVVTLLCSLLASLLTAVILINSGRLSNRFAPLEEAAGIIRDYAFFAGEDTEPDALIESALRGMAQGNKKDDYAQYMTAEEYEEMLADDSGEYTGIGISIIEPDERGTLILKVYADSPMEEAGVRAGDIITHINGSSAAGITSDEMLALFHYSDEVAEELTLLRGDVRFDVSVFRRVIHVPRVYAELLEDRIGYVRIEEFTGNVAQEFSDALARLTDGGMTRLVIDLRNNPGGGLNEVLEVTDAILDKDELIVSIRPREGEGESYYAEKDGFEMPIAILVNGYSASASELFTGALKDHNRAFVVGERTFGKGIVQSFYRLRSNGGWIKLTSDAYYTPSGTCIQDVGIEPDLYVELSGDYDAYTDLSLIPHEDDTQLQAALAFFVSDTQWAPAA